MSKLGVGMDHEIAPGQFDVPRFEAEMSRCAPRAIAFTSKKAASVWTGEPTARLALGHHPARRFGRSEIFVLSSPSGAATRYWTVEPWAALAAFLGRAKS
jgi:TDG/mug DNA glycosylase family protein